LTDHPPKPIRTQINQRKNGKPAGFHSSPLYQRETGFA
jgi:hypothetical protein